MRAVKSAAIGIVVGLYLSAGIGFYASRAERTGQWIRALPSILMWAAGTAVFLGGKAEQAMSAESERRRAR